MQMVGLDWVISLALELITLQVDDESCPCVPCGPVPLALTDFNPVLS